MADETTSEIREDGAYDEALKSMPMVAQGQAWVSSRASHLSRQQKEELIQFSIPQNACYAFPSEGTRAGWELTFGSDDRDRVDQSLIEDFQDYRDTMGSEDKDSELISDRELCKWAQIEANIYGGAGLVLGVDDGRPPDEPINYENIRKIAFIESLDGYYLRPEITGNNLNPMRVTHYHLTMGLGGLSEQLQDFLSTNKGNGSRLIKSNNHSFYRLHKSRVIRFDGRLLPGAIMGRMQGSSVGGLQGWGQSILDLLYREFNDYENIYGKISDLVSDYSLFVYFLKGLSDKQSAGQKRYLEERFRLLKKSGGMLDGLALDADNERVEFISRSFAGLPDLIDRYKERLVAVSNVPTSILFGQGPVGLASQGTGESERKVWEQVVNQWQETVLKQKLKRLFKLAFSAKDSPTQGQVPEGWGIRFRPLSIKSEQEEMDIRATASQVYLPYVRDGILLPEEVRRQFAGNEYTTEIILDEDAWNEKKQQEMFGSFGLGGGMGGYGMEQQGQLPPEQAPLEEAPVDPAAMTTDSIFDKPRHSPKRIISWNGLDIGVSHDKGDLRYGTPMKCSYGHIRRSYGDAGDGQALDVYLGDNPNGKAYKVRQLDVNGFYDEDKYMMGFSSPQEARSIFASHAGLIRFGGIEEVPEDELVRYRCDSQEEEKRPIDYLVEIAQKRGDKEIQEWVSRVEKELFKNDSIENAIIGIPDLYDKLKDEKFAQVIRESMELGAVSGRSEVMEEISGEVEI